MSLWALRNVINTVLILFTFNHVNKSFFKSTFFWFIAINTPNPKYILFAMRKAVNPKWVKDAKCSAFGLFFWVLRIAIIQILAVRWLLSFRKPYKIPNFLQCMILQLRQCSKPPSSHTSHKKRHIRYRGPNLQNSFSEHNIKKPFGAFFLSLHISFCCYIFAWFQPMQNI